MTGPARRDVDRVADILDAIDRIQRWSVEGVDDMYRAAVLHELMVIGEAAGALSDEFRAAHPDIPWQDIIGQRVLLAHHYWRTQWQRIERTVAEDLPALSVALRSDPSPG
jgi:uncharacterized protein with HEPN domain